jgi:hypothetical protein
VASDESGRAPQRHPTAAAPRPSSRVIAVFGVRHDLLAG